MKNYMINHWRGEAPLPVSFWINGVILYICLIAAIIGLSPMISHEVVNYFLLPLFAVVFIWQILGIIRASIKRMRNGATALSRGWGVLALLVMAGIILQSGRDLIWLFSN